MSLSGPETSDSVREKISLGPFCKTVQKSLFLLFYHEIVFAAQCILTLSSLSSKQDILKYVHLYESYDVNKIPLRPNV